ncbi:hypothetical protein BVX98_00010 [bacterium F11]|nr:hypothetical protein BVX98_00010 [bacterium F11]
MIDLQIHTTDSDGTWTYEQVLDHCVGMGLSAFAITDHDTINRRDQLKAWGQGKACLAIPGIELSTRENDQTVHLLGYFLDGSTDLLQKKLDILREARFDRNGKIIRKLQELGYSITEEEVKRVAGKGIIGRPHIARLLLQKGYIKSIKEAFDRFLGVKGRAYFPKEELPLKEGIELLHRTGAVTSVAHPLLLNRGFERMEDSIKLWASWNLDGLEGIYPSYSLMQTTFVHRMTTKYNLIVTGGSDFHGDNKPDIKIGVGTGDLNVPDELLEPLLAKRDEISKSIGVKQS